MPRLHEALAQVDDGAQLARMQRALRCAAQHLIWTGIMGGFLNETGAMPGRGGSVSCWAVGGGRVQGPAAHIRCACCAHHGHGLYRTQESTTRLRPSWKSCGCSRRTPGPNQRTTRAWTPISGALSTAGRTATWVGKKAHQVRCCAARLPECGARPTRVMLSTLPHRWPITPTQGPTATRHQAPSCQIGPRTRRRRSARTPSWTSGRSPASGASWAPAPRTVSPAACSAAGGAPGARGSAWT